jgi:hypothetical protein
MDFFAVPTITFGVLYCFFVISHDRRRIRHFNFTKHPRACVSFSSCGRSFHSGQLPGFWSLTGSLRSGCLIQTTFPPIIPSITRPTLPRKMIENYKVESVAVRTRQGSSSPGCIASRGISLDRARGAWPQAPAREESAHPNAAAWASCELCFYLAPDRTSPRFLLDNGCRVEFDLSHSKQRIGVMSTRQYGEGLNERRDATIHRATRPWLSPPPLSRCIFSPSRPSNRLGRFHLTDLFQFAVADAVPRWICYS